jgi:hypothetical protein
MVGILIYGMEDSNSSRVENLNSYASSLHPDFKSKLILNLLQIICFAKEKCANE